MLLSVHSQAAAGCRGCGRLRQAAAGCGRLWDLGDLGSFGRFCLNFSRIGGAPRKMLALSGDISGNVAQKNEISQHVASIHGENPAHTRWLVYQLAACFYTATVTI